MDMIKTYCTGIDTDINDEIHFYPTSDVCYMYSDRFLFEFIKCDINFMVLWI